MGGKTRSSEGFDPRFTKYKSGRNIVDELTKIGDLRLNKKINHFIDKYYEKIKSIKIIENSYDYHYFMTLLLHDKKDVIEKMNMNNYLKNNLCSFCTSIYRDILREKGYFKKNIF